MHEVSGAFVGSARYATGKKISKKDFRELKIEPDSFHGDWNYVIKPRTERR